MPSHEDYLDQLLKGLSDSEGLEETGADYVDSQGEFNLEDVILEDMFLEPDTVEETVFEEMTPESMPLGDSVPDTYSEEIVIDAMPETVIPEPDEAVLDSVVSELQAEELLPEAAIMEPEPEAEIVPEVSVLEPEPEAEAVYEEAVPEAGSLEYSIPDTYSEEIVVDAMPETVIPEPDEAVLDPVIPELQAEELLPEAAIMEPEFEAVYEEAVPEDESLEYNIPDTYSEEIVVDSMPETVIPEPDDAIDAYSEDIIIDGMFEDTAGDELPQEGSGTISMEKLLEETAEEIPENAESNPVKEDISEKSANEPISFDSEIPIDMSEIDELLKFSEEDETEDGDPGMSEEQIEQVLQANRMADSQTGESEVPPGEEDLLSLLEEAGEDSNELQDIHDMLQKSDNNEAVDEDLIAKMQELTDVTDENDDSELAEESADSAEGELTERQKKVLEKKRLKEEKAAAKKAAKEAKKAEKLAKKAAKAKKGKPDTDIETVGTDVLETTDAGSDVVEAADLGTAEAETEKSADDTMLDEFFDSELFSDVASSDGEVSGEEAENGDKEALADADESLVNKPKKNLFARILDFLTEEDEDEESSERGTEDILLSDENKQVLDEMDQEESGGKGKKKKKKDKKEKKKGKQAAGAEEDNEEAEEGKQKKKPKKAKKEKPPKEEKEGVPVNPRNRITFKKILPVLLIGVSLFLVILLFVNLGGDFTVKRQAKKAFYAEDYETCYQELYGRKLSESEQVMFGKSESILCIRLWMREYELFANEGAEVEALDVLIQSVKDYAALYAYANQWNAADEVSEVYNRMIGILQDKYGLTESQALEIAAEPDDVEYTKLVTAAAQGKGYHPSTGTQKPIELPDMLPEEKQFPENNGGR